MILVIGANSFLGLNLVTKLLENTDSIKVLVEPLEKTSDIIKNNNKIIKETCDLEDFPAICLAMQNVSYVYNLNIYNKTTLKKKEIYKAIVGTANIINAALLSNIKKLIHISSVAALCNTKAQNYVDVSEIYEYPKKNNLYSINHYEANREVYRGIYEGLKAEVVYIPLFIEDQNLISKLEKYYSSLLRFGKTIIAISKISNVINFLCRSDLDKHIGNSFILVEENLLFGDFVNKLNINTKKINFLKKLVNTIFYLYNKNKIILDNEISFWLNNKYCYINKANIDLAAN